MATKLAQRTALLCTLLYVSIAALGQRGSAPNNYYPDGYNGDIFKGVVTDTGDNQITLAFQDGNRTETFTGQFERGCSVPTSRQDGRSMMPPDIPKGTEMTAFFIGRTRKVDGKKINDNLVIGISVDRWQGQDIPENRRKIFWCTDTGFLRFKAFQ